MEIDDFLPKRVVVSLLIVAVIIAIGILASQKLGPRYLEWRYGTNEEQKATDNANTPDAETRSPSRLPGGTEVSRGGSVLPPALLKKLSSSQILQLEYDQARWNEERGYFSQEHYDQYATYDNEVLSQLAREGDLLALDILADNHQAQGERAQAAHLRWIAAIHGSTAALNDLATMHQVQLWKDGLGDERRTEHLIGMLAHAEVSAMRGDRTGVWTQLMGLHQEKITLEESVIKKSSSVARELYSELESQRAALGLNGFDNSKDALTEFQMDYMISALPNPNQWAAEYIGESPIPVIETDDEGRAVLVHEL